MSLIEAGSGPRTAHIFPVGSIDDECNLQIILSRVDRDGAQNEIVGTFSSNNIFLTLLRLKRFAARRHLSNSRQGGRHRREKSNLISDSGRYRCMLFWELVTSPRVTSSKPVTAKRSIFLVHKGDLFRVMLDQRAKQVFDVLSPIAVSDQFKATSQASILVFYTNGGCR